ncbi:hypothetical protein PLICRDRAFT_110171, partial [Plicaturopsis crispa FD-325 SS-3]
GTRVFFWGPDGDIKYGTVQSTSHMAEGTQVVVIKVDNGTTVSLPYVRYSLAAR